MAKLRPHWSKTFHSIDQSSWLHPASTELKNRPNASTNRPAVLSRIDQSADAEHDELPLGSSAARKSQAPAGSRALRLAGPLSFHCVLVRQVFSELQRRWRLETRVNEGSRPTALSLVEGRGGGCCMSLLSWALWWPSLRTRALPCQVRAIMLACHSLPRC